MRTDDERRVVAAKLRRLANEHGGVVSDLVARHLGLVPHERYIARSVYTSDSVSHLADLIGPEPERTCRLVETDHDYETSYRCTGCKRVVWVDYKGNPKPNYCPNCGARVVE